MYPRGALQVQCSVCHTLNDASQSNQLGHLVCGGCQITLMYAYGAQSVKCAVCNHVTPTQRGGGVTSQGPALTQQPFHQQQQQNQQQQPYMQQRPMQSPIGSGQGANPGQPTQLVLVENPPTIDDAGNEVENVALGLSSAAR